MGEGKEGGRESLECVCWGFGTLSDREKDERGWGMVI
jgi:hypothetical protein